MDGQDVLICTVCGDRVEDGRSRICYGCFLDGLIPNPNDYIKRELYVYDAAYKHRNATARPPTGNKMLDSTPVRFDELFLPEGLALPW